MKGFNFKIPQNIEFGIGSLKKLPTILAENNSDHVFLISDRGLASLGVVKKIEDIIAAAGIRYTSWLDVLPNPTVDIVNNATAAYQQCGATSIVALGGGSSMDVAKAVGVLANYGGSITDYEGSNNVPGPIVPMIAIPTTAGTGSEVTASSVITDEARNYKLSVISYEILPKYALLDPELIMTAPASIAAACGIDALIHAIEAYLSTNASPFTDAMAEKAMQLIGGSLRRFIANRKDESAACDMMLGSTFAGIAFAWARLGNVHAMSHPVSAFFHVPHGVANAILLPTVLEYNALADRGRYKTIFNYIREGHELVAEFTPQMLVNEVRKLNKDCGIPPSLSAVGVKADAIADMARDAMKSGNVLVNPRQSTLNDIIHLYNEAL
ncbi:iron-containing alcohol dehydrogenase [Escherichia coli]|uniref:iron-containing alcohol dehydrogenase n=1 Tax=Escherichia sp. MOD1-EC7003 TaxID=2093900 RepID=UPI000CF79D70|nr:iron-containing alcohol dehydrogenase [Escherichia sp. MOD1-EC7003]EGO8359204.1 iron-containing alcohol dehydrogenase [Escherichia coli]EGO8376475.1 iron-containing alcohol dehydrogenase [Escherichia coli]EHR8835205.1 iron-containing alcohol dehydrogenase [Escherichia coli]MCH0694169.1 iron-containing alcohol dehydrogenase [Escherichia coli]